MPELPVDFEKKVREPSSPRGGYPYSISAKDLMANFVHAALEASKETHGSGLKLEETTDYGQGGHPKRVIRIAGEITGTTPGDITDQVENSLTELGGQNANITIRQYAFDNNGAVYDPSLPDIMIYFRNGLYVGTSDPADAPPQLDNIEITRLFSSP